MNLLKGLVCLWGVLSNQRGQIPSSLTDDYDALLTTSLRSVQPRLHDNITRGNKIVSWLDSRGRTRTVDGGERIAIPLMHAQNSTADIYSGYGILDTTPQDGITTAFYTWAQLAVSIAISRLEKRQNSGKAKILDLLEAKTMQAEVSIKELLNNCLVQGRLTATAAASQFTARVGRLDSGASGPLPIPAIIDVTNDRSVSIGNINGSTYSFWRNTATNSAASSFVTLRNELNQTYNLVSRGVGGSPDFILADRIGWEQYWLAISTLERYVIDDKKTLDVLGGSDALKFRGATMIWDEVVPDPQASANLLDGGTIAESVYYFINSAAMDFVTDSSSDFITTPFVRPENQDASVAQILWMGAVGTNNRRKLGVLGSVSQSITS